MIHGESPHIIMLHRVVSGTEEVLSIDITLWIMHHAPAKETDFFSVFTITKLDKWHELLTRLASIIYVNGRKVPKAWLQSAAKRHTLHWCYEITADLTLSRLT